MTLWATSRTQRTVVGRLERNELVLEALRQEAVRLAIREAKISAWGTIKDVSIALFDTERKDFSEGDALPGTSAVIHFEGRLTSVEGKLQLVVNVVLARDTDVIAGRLVSARAGLLEVAFDCWDDLDGLEPPPRMFANASPSPAPMPATVERASTLAEVARVLDQMPQPEEPEEDPVGEPEPGDLLDHPTFGIVEYEEEAEGGRARIKLSTGSRREVMLEVFDVQPREPLRGKKLWALKPRRR
jgi:predicted DNA-binding protein with PD1-like motif